MNDPSITLFKTFSDYCINNGYYLSSTEITIMPSKEVVSSSSTLALSSDRYGDAYEYMITKYPEVDKDIITLIINTGVR